MGANLDGYVSKYAAAAPACPTVADIPEGHSVCAEGNSCFDQYAAVANCRLRAC